MAKIDTAPTLGGLAGRYYNARGITPPQPDDARLDVISAANSLSRAHASGDRQSVRHCIGLVMLHLTTYAAEIGADPVAAMLELMEENA